MRAFEKVVAGTQTTDVHRKSNEEALFHATTVSGIDQDFYMRETSLLSKRKGVRIERAPRASAPHAHVDGGRGDARTARVTHSSSKTVQKRG